MNAEFFGAELLLLKEPDERGSDVRCVIETDPNW
jgi:hypothetical protein